MERAMSRDNIRVNDRQLACARINSQEGQGYLTAMACAGAGCAALAGRDKGRIAGWGRMRDMAC